MKTQVYFRADGSATMGLGHIHRSLALAEMLRDHFECRFVVRSPLPGLRELILKSCDEIVDIGDVSVEEELTSIIDRLQGDEIVVLDGYGFTTDYQQRIKQNGNALVCIDDLQAIRFEADVIINPSGGVDRSKYDVPPNAMVCSGPKYALLKSPFLDAARHRVARVGKPSLFICMGGADPHNHTLATVKENVGRGFETVYVIIGEAYHHKDELFETVKAFDQKVEILSNLSPSAMADVMKACAVAFCSASGVAYEYASVGGELYLKQTADNQLLLYNFLLAAGMAFRATDFRADAEQAARALQQQVAVFDGQSGARLVKVFSRLDFMSNSTIRRATLNDLMTVFEWVNDPELRRQSFSSDPIPLANHTAWFTKKVADPLTAMFIVEYKGTPVAQVRFDTKDSNAIVSYSMDARYRGKGWGQGVLERAIQSFRTAHRASTTIIGYVKTSNLGSAKIFRNLGFVQHKTNDYPNAYKFELSIP